ncbi:MULTISPECIES: glycoside hydrolase family 2 TIM barrel-domain containing protein [unclassified Microbulbifer]|uniref:glycoside hydrolase family 2 protein n=1 Tax=unclassified Microbulbifer TaxID=2619833 RepID=UPI0027E55C0A|nr:MULTISPECIES: glycoside hydrolase family 2 TIM barrel-domain containing protein [unclassified Microbulbifer]
MKCWLILFIVWLPSAFAVELIQNTESRDYQSLNGEWDVIVDAFDVGDKRKFFTNTIPSSPSQLVEYNFSSSLKLQVPGDWNTQNKELFRYEGSVWYHRKFTVDKRKNKNYVLYFGAVNYIAKVYLNGELLGEHEGGFTPFQFNVNDNLKDGENSLVVKVNNRRELDYIPTMSTDWWNYGGITRSVKLLELESGYISDYSVVYAPGSEPAIKAYFKATGDYSKKSKVQFRIPELGINATVALDKDGKTEVIIPADPKLWTPEDPKLYGIEIAFKGRKVVDRIGFRTVDIDGKEILLNGEPVFLRGISIHEESPKGAGRAWSEEDARTLLSWAKELGCNYVRLAHYPHNEAMLRIADEMGLLVWAEIPVYWDIQFGSEEVYKKAETQYTEMLTRDKNRAAIILWSIANETPKDEVRTEFLGKLVDKVHSLDPTRLVTAAINTQSTTEYGRRIDDPFAEKVDVIGINTYCGWYEDTPEECANYRWVSDYNKPIIVSEFGAGALQGFHGDEHQVFTEENQALVYRYNLEMLDNMKDLRGVSPWILKDFLSPRRPLANIQDYWNRKGLLSENGVKKKAWYVMKDWYEEKAKQAASDSESLFQAGN